MSDVDVWIKAAELADTFEHMRTWLDHNDCIPANFDVRTGEPDTVLVVHVEFDRDDVAEAFQRDFGAASRDPGGEKRLC
jgi:hypothetical protein